MFYEVRVLDANGSLKKTIDSEALSLRYWQNIFKIEKSRPFMAGDKALVDSRKNRGSSIRNTNHFGRWNG